MYNSIRRFISALIVVSGVGAAASAETPASMDMEMEMEEFSLDEALDLVYADYITGIAPEALKPYAALTIQGAHSYDADILTDFVRVHNPDFDSAIAQSFIDIGRRYGLRGDVALCQAIVETGWFRYKGGTAVTPECHNYCGLGVTNLGVQGAVFATVADGVTAHLQHLYAYATNAGLPAGETLLDPRFGYVRRGVAPRWHDLNQRWAMNDRYSTAILSVYASLAKFAQQKR